MSALAYLTELQLDTLMCAIEIYNTHPFCYACNCKHITDDVFREIMFDANAILAEWEIPVDYHTDGDHTISIDGL